MTIVFCLPGQSYSGLFLERWSDLLASCILKGVTPIMRREYTSNVYLTRNMILEPDILKRGFPMNGVQPLRGTGYDWLMWIDSDAVFRSEDVWHLMDHNVDICTGSAITNMEQGRLQWGFHNSDGTCEFARKIDLDKYNRNDDGLIEVEFTGFHFLLVRRGVFEKLGYPWFRPVPKVMKDQVFFPSEDISWCSLAIEAGFKIHVDPTIKLGHLKAVTLTA
jgi:hypothetical protein